MIYTYLDDESSLYRVKHILGDGGGVARSQLYLVSLEGSKQSLLLLGGQDIPTMEGAVENSGPPGAVHSLHVHSDGTVQDSDNNGRRS